MYTLMIIIFVLGYFFIAMEHPFKIDKAASANIQPFLLDVKVDTKRLSTPV